MKTLRQSSWFVLVALFVLSFTLVQAQSEPFVVSFLLADSPTDQGWNAAHYRGIEALKDLGEAGVNFIYNTPNQQSLPGYLKMGWHVVGRLPVSVRMRSPVSALRVLRARVPADKWSTACDAGVPALDVLRDETSIASLLSSRATTMGLNTRRTPAFLAQCSNQAPMLR